MKFPAFIKTILEYITLKKFGPSMSKYAQQYNLPSRKLTRKLAREKRKLAFEKRERTRKLAAEKGKYKPVK